MDVGDGYQSGRGRRGGGGRGPVGPPGPRYDNRGQYYDNRGYSGDRGTNVPRGPGGGGPGGGWGWQQGASGGGRQQYNTFEQGGNYSGGRGGGGGRGRGRQNWGRGNYRSNTWSRPGGRGGPPQEHLPADDPDQLLPPDVQPLTELSGHSNKITTIMYEPTSQQLYTGSADGTVRTWSTVTGQCVSSVEVGGEVDALLLGGGYLFVGLHKGAEGIIKVWNMASAANHLLTGHKGPVLSLAVAGAALVSAGQDATIRVWNFNQAAGIFMSQAIIGKEDGGHAQPIHALCVCGPYMFSADRGGTIVAWDLATGKAVQRLPSAHSDQPIMQLLAFEGYLLSAGMDGLVRAWQIAEAPVPGLALRPDPEYTFDRDTPGDGAPDGGAGGQAGGFGRQRRARALPGIVTMAGTTDAAGSPVLMVAYNGEAGVRLYQLPDFAARGALTPAPDTRSLGSVAGTVMLTGDSHGRVRVFQWKGLTTV